MIPERTETHTIELRGCLLPLAFGLGLPPILIAVVGLVAWWLR